MKLTKTLLIVATLVASLGTAGCGRSDLGRSPSQVVIESLEAASGAEPDSFSSSLGSDVQTLVKRTVNGSQVDVATIYNDFGRAKFRIILRDQGSNGSPSIPTAVNGVTFTRYRVNYIRTDGRNTPGLDVPYGFDSAFTVTVPPSGEATATFELVRHVAKEEAPLRALANNPTIISAIAEITFYGKDLSGTDVVASGNIGVLFGNLADPQ